MDLYDHNERRIDRDNLDENYRVRVTTFAGGLAAAWRGAGAEWIALVAL